MVGLDPRSCGAYRTRLLRDHLAEAPGGAQPVPTVTDLRQWPKSAPQEPLDPAARTTARSTPDTPTRISPSSVFRGLLRGPLLVRIRPIGL